MIRQIGEDYLGLVFRSCVSQNLVDSVTTPSFKSDGSKIGACIWLPHITYLYIFCKLFVGFACSKVRNAESNDGFTLPNCKYIALLELIRSTVCT